MNNGLFKVVRKVLDPVWKKACLRGSTSWGPKKGNNLYSGINMIMVIGKEAVIVSVNQQGRPIIHQFRETGDTILGRRVSEILAKAGLSFIKVESRPAKTLETLAQEVIILGANGMWYCPKCKYGDRIDFISDSDHQENLKKAYLEHGRVSPDCDAANVTIYQLIDGRMTKLEDFSQIAAAKRI